MFEINTLHRSGTDNKFHATDPHTNEDVVLEEMFSSEIWDCPEAFKMAGIRGYEPMTAKELDTEEKQDFELGLSENILEEKFDGTRALVYFLSQEDVDDNSVGFCRIFSRRISKKTNFYVENSDSLPHLRDIDVPDLSGTILDGEMFINGRPFKDVSSTLNCKWDKAIDRQLELGFITFHAFDILFYKGIDLRKMPLIRRKEYLRFAVEEANSPYIEEVKYFNCGEKVCVCDYEDTNGHISDVYKSLKAKDLLDCYPTFSKEAEKGLSHDMVFLSPRAFYEYIVATGGEGVIVKPKKGLYHHKRGWEYSKIKKFLTRELILIGFDEPTKEYTGKAPKNWAYYEDGVPVTKHYYNKQVGNMILGVLLTEDELNNIPENKRGHLHQYIGVNNDELYLMEVCNCGGYSDEERAYFTRNADRLVGKVVEVKCNEIMKDSGRMRHPRYLRMRDDKEAERCIWIDHINTV